MAIRSRSETVQHTDTVQLKAQFRGPDGLPVDLDSFPQVSIGVLNRKLAIGQGENGGESASVGPRRELCDGHET